MHGIRNNEEVVTITDIEVFGFKGEYNWYTDVIIK